MSVCLCFSVFVCVCVRGWDKPGQSGGEVVGTLLRGFSQFPLLDFSKLVINAGPGQLDFFLKNKRRETAKSSGIANSICFHCTTLSEKIYTLLWYL